MDDLEPTDESPDSGAGGGLGSFLNSTRNVIGAITGLILAISGLLVALNKVGILDGGGGDDATTETRPFGPITRPIGRVYSTARRCMSERLRRAALFCTSPTWRNRCATSR